MCADEHSLMAVELRHTQETVNDHRQSSPPAGEETQSGTTPPSSGGPEENLAPPAMLATRNRQNPKEGIEISNPNTKPRLR